MSAIARVILHYFPRWEPPANRKEWNPCLCPNHAEEHPSCAVNYDIGAIKCHSCGFKGDVLSIVKRQEGVSYSEAISTAERILEGGDEPVRVSTTGKRGRRVLTDSGTAVPKREKRSRQVPPWLLQ